MSTVGCALLIVFVLVLCDVRAQHWIVLLYLGEDCKLGSSE